MASWTALSSIKHGKIVKPFLPMDKPALGKLSDNFCNVYPGDEVYLFEENNGQWGRGYVVSQAKPSDFSSAVINLNRLPEQRIKVAIVPLSHVRILRDFELVKHITDNSITKLSNERAPVPSMLDTEISTNAAVNGYDGLMKPGMVNKPDMPSTEAGDDMILELKAASSWLTSHIYAVYSIGEFQLFSKLLALYDELENVRITFNKKLYTKEEDIHMRKQASALLTRIPKYLSATEKLTNYEELEKSKLAHVDLSGYHAVMARDPNNGELLQCSSASSPVTPSQIAMNQILYALSASYPLNDIKANLDIKSHGALDRLPPSNIMVNFEAVSGSTKNTPTGYKGMIAYLYLRNKKKRLTESFAIEVGSNQELQLESVSAALFKNIPPTEIDNSGKVYLVAALAEEIDLSSSGKDLQYLRKGIAAGVTDISRIFSRHKGALASGESHQFAIKMYGSFITPYDNVSASPATRNNGWGELVERIIQGSSSGVAVNPRAESLIVSVKEIKNKTMADEAMQTAANTPLIPIRTTTFDPLSLTNERIYMRVGAVALEDQSAAAKKSFLSITIKLSNTNHTIVKGSNQFRRNYWDCVSVVPDEVVGEVLSIAGITADDDISSPNSEDVATFVIHSNGQLKAEGKFVIKKGPRVMDTAGNEITVPLYTEKGAKFGNIGFSLDYIGTKYNTDPVLQTVISWKQMDINKLADILRQLQKKTPQQLLRVFSELLKSLLEILDMAVAQQQKEMESLVFECVVYMLDVVVGRTDHYNYIFDDFCELNSGKFNGCYSLLSKAAEILLRSDREWNQIGRQLCRVSPLVFKLSITCSTENLSNHLRASTETLNKAITFFMSLTDAKFIPEQVAITENLHYYCDQIISLHEPAHVWAFYNTLLEQMGTRGLGLKEEAEFLMSKSAASSNTKIASGGDTNGSTSGGAASASVSSDAMSIHSKVKNDANSVLLAKKKKDEHRFIVSKLTLNRKLLHGSLLKTDQRNAMVLKTIDWSLEVLLSSYDIDASRLATGNLVKCFDEIWANVVLTKDHNNWFLVRAVTRLLPIFSRIFIKYNKYCKVQGLFKSKRTFTNFFQIEYPFQELTMDSIVTRETFVELLIELATLTCYSTRFSKQCVDIETGFDAIAIEEIDETTYLRQKHYTKKLSESNIISLIQMSKLTYDASFFPADKWLSLYALFIESSFSILELLKANMITQFVPPSAMSEKFNTAIWGNYLRTILKMNTSKPAATCQLSRIPRQGCIKILGDLRERGANLMDEVWNALGWDAVEEDIVRFQLKKFTGYQSEFLSSDYSILRDLILFSMQRHPRCQVVGVNVLWTIIASECILNEEGLTELAKEAITGFYDLFHSDGYKPLLQEIETFIKLLKLTIKIDPEDVTYPQISSFIDSLSEFLYISDDLRNVPFSDEFDDDRTFHKLNLLGFLLNIDQPQLLYQFIDDMYQSNIAKGNYVQAALSLELLAKTYDWSLHTLLPPSERPAFPQQTPFKRKEALYRAIGHNFAKGNALEQAVAIYTELREAYDKVSLDLKGLAYVNDKLAKLFADLENVDRIMPSYFRVSYLGTGFPDSLRNKHFIHQGLPFEQLSSMQDRLCRLYAGSRVLTKESDLQKYQEHTPIGKYLYVNSVEPGKGFEAQNSLALYSARLYMQNKDLRNFVSMKRLPNATGIHDLWCDEYIYETYESFPALMNRSEIKETRLNKLSPIENAYRAIVTKNYDLANIESLIESSIKDQEDASVHFGELSRQVSGTVDSPVNGGIGQYRVFFTDSEEELGSEQQQQHVAKLRSAFNDLAIILNRCLEWHGRLLSSPKLKDSHAELLKLFKQNFKPEIESLQLIIRDTSDDTAGSMYNGYTPSFVSSENDTNSNISRTRTNNSYTSSSSSELAALGSSTSNNSSGLNKSNNTPSISGSASSIHSGANSTATRKSNGSRLAIWSQRRG